MLWEWPYRAALSLYKLGISIAATRSEKAKRWVLGRKKQQLHLLDIPQGGIWVHCASLGEYEQGLPVIEALQRAYPSKPIVLSFFSPSGYEVLKARGTYAHLLYLPLDSPQNAQNFLDAIKPSLAIFVKYEYWYYYLQELHSRKVPTLLISAIFRSSSVHFKAWGVLHKQMLRWFSQIFVQDPLSAELVGALVNTAPIIAGDTRFDRVLSIMNSPVEVPFIQHFCDSSLTLIAGSTWPADENIVIDHFKKNRGQYKLIIAPHEISDGAIKRIEDMLGEHFMRYSHVSAPIADNIDVLIIDSIGKLSQLYKYGQLAYIGGGFGAGIHNTLEAAANGIPITFGPKYAKFQEAVDLIDKRAAFTISNASQYNKVMKNLMEQGVRQQAGLSASSYVTSRAGATDTILKYIGSNIFNENAAQAKS